MSNRVKIAVAAVIIAALVVLIVLDRNTSGMTDLNDGAVEGPNRSTDRSLVQNGNPGRTPPPTTGTNEHTMELDLGKDFEKRVGKQQPPFAKPLPPGKEKRNEKPKAQPVRRRLLGQPAHEPYVIRSGDSFSSIAKSTYGSEAYWKHIARANPGIRKHALPIGKTIQIPPKPGSRLELEEGNPEAGDFYTILPGDTLDGISHKLFGSVRYSKKIFELNQNVLRNPNRLSVGVKLSLPQIIPSTAQPTVEQQPVPSSGTKLYTVQSGESLWKIATRYAQGGAIFTKMKEIAHANPDKFRNLDSMIRAGWKIVIPE